MAQKPDRLMIDGKPVRVFLFGRKSHIDGRPVLYQVEGFDKDHALRRLCEVEHWIEKREWDFIDELDPEHDVGAMGRKLPLLPQGVIARPIFSPFISRLKH